MSLKHNDEVYDFLADQCEAGLITLEQYNAMKKELNEMPSGEEMDEPTHEEILDDHIQGEVDEIKRDNA